MWKKFIEQLPEMVEKSPELFRALAGVAQIIKEEFFGEPKPEPEPRTDLYKEFEETQRPRPMVDVN